MLWDLLRLVDILQSRSEVDPERLGVGGLSMGGEWTMWSAACDPRLKAAVVSGWMCTTEGVFAVPNCECWELAGLRRLDGRVRSSPADRPSPGALRERSPGPLLSTAIHQAGIYTDPSWVPTLRRGREGSARHLDLRPPVARHRRLSFCKPSAGRPCS